MRRVTPPTPTVQRLKRDSPARDSQRTATRGPSQGKVKLQSRATKRSQHMTLVMIGAAGAVALAGCGSRTTNSVGSGDSRHNVYANRADCLADQRNLERLRATPGALSPPTAAASASASAATAGASADWGAPTLGESLGLGRADAPMEPSAEQRVATACSAAPLSNTTHHSRGYWYGPSYSWANDRYLYDRHRSYGNSTSGANAGWRPRSIGQVGRNGVDVAAATTSSRAGHSTQASRSSSSTSSRTFGSSSRASSSVSRGGFGSSGSSRASSGG